MDYDGKVKVSEGWDPKHRLNWWGPYMALGAAIDTALSTGSGVRLCSGCNPNHGIE